VVNNYNDRPINPKIRALAKVVKQKVSIPDYMEEIAYPELGSYFGEVPFKYRDVCCCCLHHEKTASMRYYPDTESFYCFGCDTGGNVINLHIQFVKRNKGVEIEYEEAVEFLYNYFVLENKTVELSKERSKIGLTAEQIMEIEKEEQAVREENVIRMRFTKAVGNVEGLLLRSTTLPQSVKNNIFNTIDSLEILVGVGELSPEAALHSLKVLTEARTGIKI